MICRHSTRRDTDLPATSPPTAVIQSPSLRSQIIREADRCVMCAHCLPHCPTFSISGHEAESPRGRIALLKALAEGKLAATADLTAHIDHCLGCRACEHYCPSQVRYNRLLQNGLQLLADSGTLRSDPGNRLIQRLLERERPLFRLGYRLLKGYRLSRLRALLRNYGLLRRAGAERADSLLSAEMTHPPTLEHSPAITAHRGTVALFTGCNDELMEPATRGAAIRVLNRFGFDVVIPARQGCCGALARNRGDLTTAMRLAQNNRRTFSRLGVEVIVSYNSGCAATLASDDIENSVDHDGPLPKVTDIITLLAEAGWPEGHTLPNTPLKVVFHRPCVERHTHQPSGATLQTLLEPLTGIVLLELEPGHGCCGAAGIHTLSHPDRADELREPLIEALQASGAEILVSSNVGCARHLSVGLQQRGQSIEQLHPVVLVERLLDITESHR